MSAADIASRALVAAGVAVMVASAVALFAFPRVQDRVHLATPVTSLGLPLVGLGLAVADGWGLTTAEVLFTVFLVAVSGPVVSAAVGRLVAQREGLVSRSSPE